MGIYLGGKKLFLLKSTFDTQHHLLPPNQLSMAVRMRKVRMVSGVLLPAYRLKREIPYFVTGNCRLSKTFSFYSL